jgi:hypothetical protein
MTILSFACPKTNEQVPTGIATDAQSLSSRWRTTVKINCPHCGDTHEILVCETFMNAALDDPSACRRVLRGRGARASRPRSSF